MGSGTLKALEFVCWPYHCGRDWQEPPPFPPGFRARLHFSVSLWAEHTLVMISDQRNVGRNCASPIRLWLLKTSHAMLCFSAICLVTRQETQQKTPGALRAVSQNWRSLVPWISHGSYSLPGIFIALMCFNMTWTTEILRSFRELFTLSIPFGCVILDTA